MLVIFTCDSHADVMMLGDIASRLIRMMGHSGTVPGAIAATDVSAALEKLQQGIKCEQDAATEGEGNSEDNEKLASAAVPLATRACPLIELLNTAIRQECHVMWYGK